MTANKVVWVSPPSGTLGTFMEQDDVGHLPLVANYDNTNVEIVDFMVLSGDFPDNLHIDNTNKWIYGIIDFVENWLPGYQKPVPYTYDVGDTAFQNYANYGIYLSRVVTVNFIIRAYHRTLYDELDTDSFADRAFSITIEANYSVLRDHVMITEFPQADDTRGYLEIDGVRVTSEEFVAINKDEGYYT